MSYQYIPSNICTKDNDIQRNRQVAVFLPFDNNVGSLMYLNSMVWVCKYIDSIYFFDKNVDDILMELGIRMYFEIEVTAALYQSILL